MTAPDSPSGPADRSAEPVLRFPGGRLRHTDWTALAGLAAGGDGRLRLLPGGAMRIPGSGDAEQLHERAVGAGLSGIAVHDRAWGVLASPLAGLLPGRSVLGHLPERLAAALSSRDELAALPRDFVFGFDDGSGDVVAHGPDLTAVAHDPVPAAASAVPEPPGRADAPGSASGAGGRGGRFRLHVRGRDSGWSTSMADVVTVLVDTVADLARAGTDLRGLPATGPVHDLVVVGLSNHPLTSPSGQPPTAAAPAGAAGDARSTTTSVETPPVGWIDTSDGLVTLLAVVPDGVVPARLAEFLGAVERPSTISADRVIGLHGLTEGMAEQVVRVLAPMGMVFDAASPEVEAVRGADPR